MAEIKIPLSAKDAVSTVNDNSLFPFLQRKLVGAGYDNKNLTKAGLLALIGSNSFENLTGGPNDNAAMAAVLAEINNRIDQALNLAGIKKKQVSSQSDMLNWSQARVGDLAERLDESGQVYMLARGSGSTAYATLTNWEKLDFSFPSLGDIIDVDDSAKANDYVLTWSTSAGKWIAKAAPGSGSITFADSASYAAGTANEAIDPQLIKPIIDAKLDDPGGTTSQYIRGDGSLATFPTVPTQYTDEQARDAIGTALTDTATIDLTHNDAGDQITADLKDGAVTTPKIANDAVTFDKVQNIATNKLLGRSTAGSGNVEEITIGTGLTLTGGTLNATGTSVTVDPVPTNGSSNPVSSDGVFDALAGKQNTLTFDSAPTNGSTNPVTSDGIFDALALKANDADVVKLTGAQNVDGAKTFLQRLLFNSAAVARTNNTTTSRYVNLNLRNDDPDASYTVAFFIDSEGNFVLTLTNVDTLVDYQYTFPLTSGVLSILPDLEDNAGKVLAVNTAETAVEWVTPSTGGATNLDELTDVTITSPTTGQVLKYNGTVWVNDTDAGGLALPIFTQTAHGFVKGDILRRSGSTFVKAQANSASNAEVSGYVNEVIDANNFRLAGGGTTVDISGLGLTAGEGYVLSATTAGAMTSTYPTSVGQVQKYLLLALDSTRGMFFNYPGVVIQSPLTLTSLLASAPTANQVPQWNGSQWVPATITAGSTFSATANKVVVGSGSSAAGATNLHWDGTNSRLGIKQTTPAASLHITDTALEVMRLESSNTTGTYWQIVNSSNGRAWSFTTVGTAGFVGAAGGSLVIRNGWTEVNPMVITEGARVGLGGIVAPTAGLHLSASTTSQAALRIQSGADVTSGNRQSGDMWWNGTNLYFWNGSTLKDLLATTTLSLTTSQIAFGTGTGISSDSGFVWDNATKRHGIGVTSNAGVPQVKLHIEDTATEVVRLFSTSTTGTLVAINNTSGSVISGWSFTCVGSAGFVGAAQGSLVWRNGGSDVNPLVLTSAGLVGAAGIVAPTAFMDLPASLSGRATLRMRPGVAVTTNQNEGDMWNVAATGHFVFLGGQTHNMIGGYRNDAGGTVNINPTDRFIEVASGATVNVPNTAIATGLIPGKPQLVWNTSAGSVTISRQGSDLLNGSSSSITLTAGSVALIIYKSSLNWLVKTF